MPPARRPAALPGWLATTTRRESRRVLRATGRLPGDEQRATADHELILAERHAALRQAVTPLPPGSGALAFAFWR
jgi:hypothetical protein